MRKRRKPTPKKAVRYLSDWKEVLALARYNKKIYELIKAFREQARTLANHPF